MSRNPSAIALLACAALAACTPGGEAASAKPSREAEERALMETSRAWAKAAKTGNADSIMAYFADDAVMITAGEPTLRGKEAIRKYVEGASKLPGFAISWEPMEAHVSGDMGYMLERTTITVNGEDGSPKTQKLRAVTIWRKDDKGQWKAVVDSGIPE